MRKKILFFSSILFALLLCVAFMLDMAGISAIWIQYGYYVIAVIAFVLFAMAKNRITTITCMERNLLFVAIMAVIVVEVYIGVKNSTIQLMWAILLMLPVGVLIIDGIARSCFVQNYWKQN